MAAATLDPVEQKQLGAERSQDRRARYIRPLRGFATEFVLGGSQDLFCALEHVEAIPNAVSPHLFTMPGGGTHPTAAASALRVQDVGGDIKLHFTFPYSFQFVQSPHQPDTSGIPARAWLLAEILDYANAAEPSGPPTATTSVRQASLRIAPNPFNPKTTVELALPEPGPASVRVYNLRGQLVRMLHDGFAPAGVHRLTWDGLDGGARQVASGVYVVQAQTSQARIEEKLLLLK
jgi:hypothetical protein